MSTRSSIAMETSNGKVMYVDCHWDGYIGGVGRKLLNHYTDATTIRNLLKGGYIESLGDTPQTTEYWRYGEGCHMVKSLVKWMDVGEGEYRYLFKDGKWRVIFSNWTMKNGDVVVEHMDIPLTKELVEKNI